MAAENDDGQEKSEDPSEERRDEFRQKGEVAHSREITAVLALLATLAFLSVTSLRGFEALSLLVRKNFEQSVSFRIDQRNALAYFKDTWLAFLSLVVPLALIPSCAATAATLLQTRFNCSWERLAPAWHKLNPLAGLQRMVSAQAFLEVAKSLGKLLAVATMAYYILYSERSRVPALLGLSIAQAWAYGGQIVTLLFWSVGGLLLLIAGVDYGYHYFSLEQKLKMTKQEVKEEFKQREVNPQIKGRLRRMQRELANRKTIQASKEATVIITNPTHFAVALKYQLGMAAPIVLAKGADLLALRMREVAKEHAIPIVENPPLARTLYKLTPVGHEIPEALYQAVSEVIRYVFKLKGIRVGPT